MGYDAQLAGMQTGRRNVCKGRRGLGANFPEGKVLGGNVRGRRYVGGISMKDAPGLTHIQTQRDSF